ncbi:hypothetical protein PVK06_016832 [Gossypium arboreum]|uniref:Uncharacterized protein n=1 Tax=Gossypium arboreum TaxID=29729 RepID=A0ABR0Q1G6_GOSAR|nr:hypothetical protein PVK06_016832 [Gossypium arboreum]
MIQEFQNQESKLLLSVVAIAVLAQFTYVLLDGREGVLTSLRVGEKSVKGREGGDLEIGEGTGDTNLKGLGVGEKNGDVGGDLEIREGNENVVSGMGSATREKLERERDRSKPKRRVERCAALVQNQKGELRGAQLLN